MSNFVPSPDQWYPYDPSLGVPSVDADINEEFRQFLMARYPCGIRPDANNPNTVVWKYDWIRGYLFSVLNLLLERLKNMYSIQTCDGDMLAQWEAFLGCPTYPPIPDQTRRALILAKLNQQKGTKYAVKKLISDITCIPYDDVVISELYHTIPPGDSDDLWSYVVEIPTPTPCPFDMTALLNTLSQTHFFHNEVYLRIVFVMPPDNIGIVDDSTQFCYGDPGVWGADPGQGTWLDGSGATSVCNYTYWQ